MRSFKSFSKYDLKIITSPSQIEARYFSIPKSKTRPTTTIPGTCHFARGKVEEDKNNFLYHPKFFKEQTSGSSVCMPWKLKRGQEGKGFFSPVYDVFLLYQRSLILHPGVRSDSELISQMVLFYGRCRAMNVY